MHRLVVRQLCSDELLSHPETTLKRHLQDVADSCAEGRAESAQRLRYIVGACHDFGKATRYFQEYLADDRPQSQLTNHSAISGLACFHALRAEGFSLRECAMGWLVISRHHSPLIDTGETFQRTLFASNAPRETYVQQAEDILTRRTQVQTLYDDLGIELDIESFCTWIKSSQYIKDVAESLSYAGSVSEQPLDSSFQVVELFSQLVAADKLNAAGYDLPSRKHVPADAVESYIQDRFGSPSAETIDQLRADARESARDQLRDFDSLPGILTLTLPTGSGKTLTALDLALQIRQRKQLAEENRPRIVYALPFTSIIDQNFEVFSEVLEHAGVESIPEVLLKHHYRSRDDYVTGSHDSEATDGEFWRDLMLTNRWESEVTTTTFVQLLESLVVPSNSQSIKLPNLRDAVIILDEVQAIPTKYWDVVRACCEQLAADWGCTFIAMTATQPGIFADAPSLVPNADDYFEQLDRVRFEIDDSVFDQPLSIETLSERVVSEVRSSPSDVLVVCNTIGSARQVFDSIRSQLQTDSKELRLEYLSSAVRPRDRRDRITALRSTDREQRVVVSTQVIEAGVDLDFDIVIRDFAPLDSLVQAAGRCNRHAIGGSGGRVDFVCLVDDDGTEPATAIYDSPRLDATRRAFTNVLSGSTSLSESVVTTEVVSSYFSELSNIKNTDGSIPELQRWQFDSARIRLIPDSFSVDVFVVGSDSAESDHELYDDYAQAVRYNKRARARELKPDFYDCVVSVNLYSPRSERSEKIKRLPLPDDELGVYLLPAHKEEYKAWYSEKTGLRLPESTVESRLL